MLDGRIELFGSVEELRARGDLPQLLKADAIEGELKEELKSERTDEEAAEVEGSGTITPAEPRAARKLHQAEERSSCESGRLPQILTGLLISFASLDQPTSRAESTRCTSRRPAMAFGPSSFFS